MNIQFKPIALAISVLLGFSSVAHAAADGPPPDIVEIITPPTFTASTTTASGSSETQDRVGLMLNIPFDGSGFKFADAIINLVYQNGHVTSHGNLSGWQVAIGTRLTKFTPMFSAAALAGQRCTYGTAGVSYGDGKWGLPVFIHASHLQLGLTNAGGFGGAQLGVSSLECFKRYVPSSTVPSSGSSSGSSSNSGSSSGSFALGASYLLTSEFDWA